MHTAKTIAGIVLIGTCCVTANAQVGTQTRVISSTPVYNSAQPGTVVHNGAVVEWARPVAPVRVGAGSYLQPFPPATLNHTPISHVSPPLSHMHQAPVYSAPVVHSTPVQTFPAQHHVTNNVVQPAGYTVPGASSGFVSHGSVYSHSPEHQLLNLVNNERARHGLRPLAMDANLLNGARNHSARQHSSGRMFHAGGGYGGENVAHGAYSPQQVMRMWMNSPGHRRNILNPSFSTFGGANSGSFWTQRFR